MASDTEVFSFDTTETLQRNTIDIVWKFLTLVWGLIEPLNSQVASKNFDWKICAYVSVLPKTNKWTNKKETHQ